MLRVQRTLLIVINRLFIKFRRKYAGRSEICIKIDELLAQKEQKFHNFLPSWSNFSLRKYAQGPIIEKTFKNTPLGAYLRENPVLIFPAKVSGNSGTAAAYVRAGL